MIPCIGPLCPHVKCETLPRTSRLEFDAAGSGVSPCLGPWRLECKSLPKTMRAHAKSLSRT